MKHESPCVHVCMCIQASKFPRKGDIENRSHVDLKKSFPALFFTFLKLQIVERNFF